MNFLKTIFYNFLVFFIAIILIEIFFGYWFKDENFGIYMRKERKINWQTTSNFNKEKYDFFYKRNYWGFRSEEFDPKDVKVIFEGGSTGNQRFTPEEFTIVGLINQKLKLLNFDISIFNASTDGKSVNGYINDFNYWFSKIPNFKPEYVIFYIGLNDRNIVNPFLDYKISEDKIDQIKDKRRLLPHIKELTKQHEFAEVVPVSALSGHNLDRLESLVKQLLPVGPFLYPAEQVTDRSSRFLAAELIREKVTRQSGDELPYEVTVEIERFKVEGSVTHIHGLILVDKSGQKKILVGRDGERLKSIGSSAREEMETAFGGKVMLNLWVKVKSGWADDERALQSLGYVDH